MESNQAGGRYSRLMIALHWGMLILLVALVACMELRELFPKGSPPREAMKAWHYSLGLLVFGLALMRLGIRLFSPVPPIVPAPPLWQRRAAGLVQAGMYAVMLAMPLVGWLLLSAGGDAAPFFAYRLPALIAENVDLAETLEEIHESGATLAYILVGVHTLAALYHHYFLRDSTLRRMLP